MAPQALITTLGIGMAVTEAIRAGLDRVIPARGGIPLHVDGITAPWLTGALGLPAGGVSSLRVVEHNSGTAARARVAVKSEADLPEHLFLKLVPRNYLQHVLMNIFRLGVKEILAYRALGDNPPVRVPRCYVAEIDRGGRRSVLVLEDLSATAEFRTVIDSVTETEAEAVIDALADLHARFWASGRFADDLRPLAQRSATEIRIGDIVRRQFLADIDGHTADLIPDQVKRDCRMFYERSADIDAFWAAQPQTLIHGDPHLGNLFFEAGGPGFLDWQVASAGVGIRDVAYFASASVEPDLLRTIERDLVRRYTARLAAAGIEVDEQRQWTLYRAALTEFFLAAVCTAEAGDRMQPLAVSRVGVERTVASVTAHDSFAVLTELVDAR